MNLKINESDIQIVKSGTYTGVLINALLVAAATNNPLVASDFSPVGVQIKVDLLRKGTTYTMMNDNLLLLGTYYTRKSNYFRFSQGFPLVAPAVGVAAQTLRTAFLKFRSPVRCNAGDELRLSVQFNSGFSSNVNTAISFLDAILSPGTGYEMGIPQTRSKVVQTNSTTDWFVQTDGVAHIEFLNLDMTDWSSPVIQNINLASDKLQYNTTLYESIGADAIKWPENIPAQFGATNITPTVVRTLDALPQCLTIFEAGGNRAQSALNKCNVALSFNSANVNASKNWVMWETLYIDPSNVKPTVQRIAKHAQENMAMVSAGYGV